MSLGLLFAGAFCAWAAEEPYFRISYVVRTSALIPERYHPSLVCLPNGDLACAWAEGSGPRALDTSIKISFKPNGINDWAAPVIVADEFGFPDNYPLLCMLPNDALRLFYSTYYRDKRKVPPGMDMAAWHIKYKDSHDGGQTWSPDFFLVPESGFVPSGRVLKRSDGGIILPITDRRNQESIFLISRDGGAYWNELARLNEPPGLVDPVVTELSSGHLITILRPHEKSERKHVLWKSESNDNGHTWTQPAPMSLLNPGGPIQLLRMNNGHLILLYNDHEQWLSPLTVALSTDEGESFPYKRNLETGKWNIRDPGFAISKDNRIQVVFISRDIHIKHVELDESWIIDKPDNNANP